MPVTVRSQQGDTVDAICQRHFGYTQNVTEATLTLNPHLASKGPVLPLGTTVILPDVAPAPARSSSINLWD